MKNLYNQIQYFIHLYLHLFKIKKYPLYIIYYYTSIYIMLGDPFNNNKISYSLLNYLEIFYILFIATFF